MLTSSGALRAWVAIIINVVAIALLAGFTITYVTYQSRKICGLIVLIDDLNQTRPAPVDPKTGQPDPDVARYRRELHTYRLQLGC